MGRPTKAKVASRANGTNAKNKGSPVHLKEELFGGYYSDDTYVVRIVKVRQRMSKGEVRRCEWGWEGDVFTFCFYHGKFLRFDDANAKKIIYKSGFDENRWNAARRKATELVKRWAEMDPREKRHVRLAGLRGRQGH